MVPGPDDDAGADDQRPFRKSRLDEPLAQDLEPAVAPRRDLLSLDVPRRRLLDRGVLADSGRLEVGVDGDGGDEDVALDGAGEELRRGLDVARQVAVDVDRNVPAPPGESGEVLSAVAVEMLGLGEQLGVRPATMEQGDLMAGRERGLGEVAPDETGAAEDQDPHSYRRASIGSSAAARAAG